MLEDTYGHTPVRKAFELADVYGVGFDEERASRKKVRLAVIGAGPVAQSKYFPAIARLRTIWEPVEVVAFALRTEAQARKVEDVFGARWYKDYRTMLEQEDVEGVLVLSSDDAHAEHAAAALESGRHVLVEKPITRSLADSERLCRLAEDRGLILMTVANKRYSPPYRRAKALIERGPVSEPALFAGKFNLGYNYVDLLESGTVHLFDLCRFLMGDVYRLHCWGVNKYRDSRRNYPVDNVVVSLEFSCNAVGTIYTTSSALSLKPWERVEVYGDHAWLAVEDQYRLLLYDSEEGPVKAWEPVIPNTLLFDEEFGGYMGLIENFLQAIRGEEQPVVTGWDGHRAYELVVACHLSLARKEPVQLPLHPRSADDEALQWLRQNGWRGGVV